LYRTYNQVQVDVRDIYAFLDEVAYTTRRVDEDIEVSEKLVVANVIIDLSPAVNDRHVHVIDILPLLRLLLAEPGLICKFDFSTNIDTTHVGKQFQPCDHNITQVFASRLIQDLNKMFAGSKTLATILPKSSLVAANLNLKALGAIRYSWTGIAVSLPFLDIRFALPPP
jgi:hypothetical protein